MKTGVYNIFKVHWFENLWPKKLENLLVSGHLTVR
jgi:hypothetical protein